MSEINDRLLMNNARYESDGSLNPQQQTVSFNSLDCIRLELNGEDSAEKNAKCAVETCFAKRGKIRKNKVIDFSVGLTAVLTIVLLHYLQVGKTQLPYLSKPFTGKTVIFVIIVAALNIVPPAYYTEGLPAIMSLIYGYVVTPFYEELIF